MFFFLTVVAMGPVTATETLTKTLPYVRQISCFLIPLGKLRDEHLDFVWDSWEAWPLLPFFKTLYFRVLLSVLEAPLSFETFLATGILVTSFVFRSSIEIISLFLTFWVLLPCAWLDLVHLEALLRNLEFCDLFGYFSYDRQSWNVFFFWTFVDTLVFN